MPIPPNAHSLGPAMDPADVVDYELELGPDGGSDALLEDGEQVDDWTLTLSAEAVALGLTLGTGDYAPVQPTPTSFRFWFSVDAMLQDDSAFDSAGSSLAMELTIETDSMPPRTRQRTLILQVAQQ